jgi:GAF domain-containing protein
MDTPNATDNTNKVPHHPGGTREMSEPLTASAISDPYRLQALRDTGLVNSRPEEGFDRLTRLATQIFKAPVSLVSLVDEDRQFFKSACGLGEPWATERQTPLSHSFCQYVVGRGAPIVINNAPEDALLRTNGAVKDLNVVAYLGVPITTIDGRHTLGSFCVIDTVPRQWTSEDITLLSDLARSLMTEIEMRHSLRALGAAKERLQRAVRGSREGLWEWDFQNNTVFISPQSKAMLGYSDQSSRTPPKHGHN